MRTFNGNISDECVVVFINESDCADAMKEKNGCSIGSSAIKIEISNLNEFEEFSSSNACFMMLKKVSEYITPDKVCKSLFIMNLPLDISKDDILKYLHIFNINESNLKIDQQLLIDFGAIIVTFNSDEDATIAKNYLGKQTLDWKKRVKKIKLENLLVLINKANES